MASIIDRNGTLYAQFFDSNRTPKSKRLSLKTSDKRIARRRLAKWEEDAAYSKFDPWTDDPWTYGRKDEITIGAAFDTFIEARRKADLSPATIKLYLYDLTPLIKQIGRETPLKRLTPSQIDAYVRGGDVARSTQRKRYRLARAFLCWAVRHDLLDVNPIHKTVQPKAEDTLPRVVRPEDLERICAALMEDYERKVGTYNGVHEGDLIWAIPLFWFALYTGMRIGELARLRWQHINFEKGLIFIFKQKNGKQQTIPLNSKAAEVLAGMAQGESDEYIFRSPQTHPTQRKVKSFKCLVGRIFQRYRKAAGIERHLTFHGTRHGHCTLLAEAGKPAYIIQASARHADISTSMRYVHIANEHLKAELDDVFS